MLESVIVNDQEVKQALIPLERAFFLVFYLPKSFYFHLLIKQKKVAKKLKESTHHLITVKEEESKEQKN